jgi:hypothetical protein
LEGFVSLVLIGLILLIFLEKSDNFFQIIYLKKNPAPPRFFFQFCDIANLSILPQI